MIEDTQGKKQAKMETEKKEVAMAFISLHGYMHFCLIARQGVCAPVSMTLARSQLPIAPLEVTL
jgi:hypothetical protein